MSARQPPGQNERRQEFVEQARQEFSHVDIDQSDVFERQGQLMIEPEVIESERRAAQTEARQSFAEQAASQLEHVDEIDPQQDIRTEGGGFALAPSVVAQQERGEAASQIDERFDFFDVRPEHIRETDEGFELTSEIRGTIEEQLSQSQAAAGREEAAEQLNEQIGFFDVEPGHLERTDEGFQITSDVRSDIQEAAEAETERLRREARRDAMRQRNLERERIREEFEYIEETGEAFPNSDLPGIAEDIEANIEDETGIDVEIDVTDLQFTGSQIGLLGDVESDIEQEIAAGQLDEQYPGIDIGVEDIERADGGFRPVGDVAQEIAVEQFEEEFVDMPDNIGGMHGPGDLFGEALAGQRADVFEAADIEASDFEISDSEIGLSESAEIDLAAAQFSQDLGVDVPSDEVTTELTFDFEGRAGPQPGELVVTDEQFGVSEDFLADISPPDVEAMGTRTAARWSTPKVPLGEEAIAAIEAPPTDERTHPMEAFEGVSVERLDRQAALREQAEAREDWRQDISEQLGIDESEIRITTTGPTDEPEAGVDLGVPGQTFQAVELTQTGQRQAIAAADPDLEEEDITFEDGEPVLTDEAVQDFRIDQLTEAGGRDITQGQAAARGLDRLAGGAGLDLDLEEDFLETREDVFDAMSDAPIVLPGGVEGPTVIDREDIDPPDAFDDITEHLEDVNDILTPAGEDVLTGTPPAVGKRVARPRPRQRADRLIDRGVRPRRIDDRRLRQTLNRRTLQRQRQSRDPFRDIRRSRGGGRRDIIRRQEAARGGQDDIGLLPVTPPTDLMEDDELELTGEAEQPSVSLEMDSERLDIQQRLVEEELERQRVIEGPGLQFDQEFEPLTTPTSEMLVSEDLDRQELATQPEFDRDVIDRELSFTGLDVTRGIDQRQRPRPDQFETDRPIQQPPTQRPDQIIDQRPVDRERFDLDIQQGTLTVPGLDLLTPSRPSPPPTGRPDFGPPGRPRQRPPDGPPTVPGLMIPDIELGSDDPDPRRRDPFDEFAKELEFNIGDPFDLDIDI